MVKKRVRCENAACHCIAENSSSGYCSDDCEDAEGTGRACECDHEYCEAYTHHSGRKANKLVAIPR